MEGQTTITKEVRNYAVEQCTGYSVYAHNVCKYRKDCKRKKVCETNECKHPMVTTCRHRLGGQDFRKLFPIILTDNGSEFSNPKSIEYGPDGKGFQRTRIYYCNPSAPYQKAEIEVGYEFIRRVLPKGKSFDELMQGDINLMMNHINSYRRKS